MLKAPQSRVRRAPWLTTGCRLTRAPAPSCHNCACESAKYSSKNGNFLLFVAQNRKMIGQTRPIRALCAVSPLPPYRASLDMLLLCCPNQSTRTKAAPALLPCCWYFFSEWCYTGTRVAPGKEEVEIEIQLPLKSQAKAKRIRARARSFLVYLLRPSISPISDWLATAVSRIENRKRHAEGGVMPLGQPWVLGFFGFGGHHPSPRGSLRPAACSA
jgi:hypothetical protein